jgi:SM-20-related protein
LIEYPHDFVDLFNKIAEDLRQQGYSVNHNAVPLKLTQELLQILLGLDSSQLKPAKIGRASHVQESLDIRGDSIFWIESDQGSQGQWLDLIAKLQQYLNRSLLLGLFSFESHFAHYVPGAFYKKHVDAFKGQANRVLSVVLYLNQDWQSSDGGEMVLYSELNPEEVVCSVQPKAGTLLVFLSEEFPHEVMLTQRHRYSIAGWYRINTSSTVCVDPPV